MLKNVMVKNFIPFQFSLKILNLTHKNAFKIASVVYNWLPSEMSNFTA